MFKRLVATSRAPQIMVLSMLRSFGKIGPQIDQIWAWLSRGHRWSPGVRNPLKSSVTGLSLLVNCYLEIKFHKIIRVNPPPPPLSLLLIIKFFNFELNVLKKLSLSSFYYIFQFPFVKTAGYHSLVICYTVITRTLSLVRVLAFTQLHLKSEVK